MEKKIKIPLNSENGFAIVACLLILTILILAGMFGVRKSSTELSIVRNEGQILLEFYDAEAGLVDTLENPTTWMDNPFLLLEDSGFTPAPLDYPAVNPEATIQVRAIADDDPISPLLGGGPADKVPIMKHIAPPPDESGYSMLLFETRKYGVTAVSTDGNTQLQVGAWKVFNKF